jgi:hypothetical protein
MWRGQEDEERKGCRMFTYNVVLRRQREVDAERIDGARCMTYVE